MKDFKLIISIDKSFLFIKYTKRIIVEFDKAKVIDVLRFLEQIETD
jgi:hypothetical protein